MKELAEKLKRQITCLGENSAKYITFTIPIEKEVARIDKDGEELQKNIFYILQFIDSAIFIASSLSNLVIIFVKELIELNVNTNMITENVRLVDLNISMATAFLNL